MWRRGRRRRWHSNRVEGRVMWVLLGMRGVTVCLWRALWLWRRMVKQALSGRSSTTEVTPRWRREGVRGLAPVQRRPVDLHGSERRVRGKVSAVIQHHRRRGTSAEWTR